MTDTKSTSGGGTGSLILYKELPTARYKVKRLSELVGEEVSSTLRDQTWAGCP